MSEDIDDPELKRLLETHPCYNEKACSKFARMHLPVAPACNIQCNYCNRKYDCTNESRPGVTSEILTPEQAVEKVRYVRSKIPYLSVLGIAGPGDPLANENSFKTLELIGKEFPDMTLCLSTNGLNLPKYVARLKALGVKFITVTINAVDPEVGAKMYSFVVYEGKVLRGVEAARRLIDNQLEGVRLAAEAGMLVKVNTVMVPDVNADHIPQVAKKVKELGAYIINIIPLIPVPGTNFARIRAPTPRERKELQELCEPKIRQMRHCRQCRADAIGLLGEDRSSEFASFTCDLKEEEPGTPVTLEFGGKERYKIAVATSDGRSIDQGFGQTESFHSFMVEDQSIVQLGQVNVEAHLDEPVAGAVHREKLESTAHALAGHDAVIATEFGERAVQALKDYGIAAYVITGEVEKAILEAVDRLYHKRADTFE
ncbi:MAG: nitrogenase cofactor biosynthesis protein NifB [Methanomassiliicoccales archaeon]|jgi:nitrogen fixation protein NifB